MEPQTRYVTSADGTRIAFSTVGRGRPLVLHFPPALAAMEARWRSDQWRGGVKRLAEGRMVVQFDQRGFGLSQREVDDLSLEARVSDLKAVIDRVGASEVDLLG